MENKFSDFTKNYSNSKTKNNKEESNYKTKQNIEELYNKYSKMDNSSLFNEFLKISFEKKQKGELTNEYFENLKNNLFPYLNDEQKNYFEELVNKIK